MTLITFQNYYTRAIQYSRDRHWGSQELNSEVARTANLTDDYALGKTSLSVGRLLLTPKQPLLAQSDHQNTEYTRGR